MSSEPYYRGRSDYRAGKIIPPQTYNHIEKLQWDAGYRDEHLRNPDPIHIEAIRNVVFAYRDQREINPQDIETLELVAQALEERRR